MSGEGGLGPRAPLGRQAQDGRAAGQVAEGRGTEGRDMARVDDYAAAYRLAAEQLGRESFARIAARSGFATEGGTTFRVPFLDRTFLVDYPGFAFRAAEGADAPAPALPEQVLILHYMSGGEALPPSGAWVAYREIPGATFYFGAFVKRALDPLKKVFGAQPGDLAAPATKLGGTPLGEGDASFRFQLLPRVPVQVIVWQGDAEFAAEASILFDRSIEGFLSPEDIAWLAGMLVYRLIALSRT
jgi:hypothetical protein